MRKNDSTVPLYPRQRPLETALDRLAPHRRLHLGARTTARVGAMRLEFSALLCLEK
jgi:hypothetical protein